VQGSQRAVFLDREDFYLHFGDKSLRDQGGFTILSEKGTISLAEYLPVSGWA
jgi:hypothetical protein